MNLKLLAESKYQIVAVMEGATCPAEEFLLEGEEATRGAREGLFFFLQHVAEVGLERAPGAWFKLANAKDGIYEFKKGPLRLFFFKGQAGQIAVCTTGVRKTTQKVDKAAVAKAAVMRARYLAALTAGTLEVVDDEAE